MNEPLAQAARDALRARLAGAGVPEARTALAARALESLLARAVTVREDGTAFVVTGDITAMWLRDSAAQVRPLLALAGEVPELAALVAGVLRTQVDQVLLDPYANAFNDGPTGELMRRDFRDQSPWVFERKYEVDSPGAPLSLAWTLWRATGSAAHVDARFLEAAGSIVGLWRREQEHDRTSYRLWRPLRPRRDSLSHRGRGAPVATTGMTWSAFRPSDDACRYGYNVPANAFAAVALERLAELVEAAVAAMGPLGLAADARALAAEIRAGIAAHAVVAGPGPDGEQVLAYEVDGLGRALLMDDANVPSLLSLPYLGFCAATDPLYRATRAFVLGPGNPCWWQGRAVRGVGSPHTGRRRVWPLAILMEGLTSTGADGVEAALHRAESTVTGDLLLHESVHADAARRFTRSWFSWADMLYVELVLASAAIRLPGTTGPTG
jgi:meiotically up-regulated gene 157 (Mug157) protein